MNGARLRSSRIRVGREGFPSGLQVLVVKCVAVLERRRVGGARGDGGGVEGGGPRMMANALLTFDR